MSRHVRLGRKVHTVTLLVMAVLALGSVARVFAQSQFPQIERYIWKELEPWGKNTGPNGEVIWATPADLNNVPVSNDIVRSEPDEDDEGNVSYNTISPPGWPYSEPYGQRPPGPTSMEAAEAQFPYLAQGECTFSHKNDYDIDSSVYWPQARICKGPGDRKLPPPAGRLLNPVGIAIDGVDVYVSDLFNHRIQKFDFYGNVKPMEFPIGNGIPGKDPYNYDTLYAPNFVYRPFPSYAAGFSGHQLNAPYGIALDGSQHNGAGAGPARHLLIADTGNDRIAIFNTNGSPAFLDAGQPLHATIPIPEDEDGQPLGVLAFKPDQLAISPGAIALAPGTVVPEGDPGRIVVTDRQKCWIAIMDVGFNVLHTLPKQNPDQPQHDACLEPLARSSEPGEFSTVNAVKIDADGYIYIADHAQSVVQVFNGDGEHVASIGKPGGDNPSDEEATLSGPVGMMLFPDGRLGVIDEGHSRTVVYGLANGPANATFEFVLDTTVAWDDFPMGIEMQIGPASKGLDPKGRILVTDPVRRRILRFELPDLVVANLKANDSEGALETPDGVGSFDVVVPHQKTGDVMGVTVTITSDPEVEIRNLTASDSSDPLNIAPGSVVHYTFEYTMPPNTTRVTFNVKARGDRVGTSNTYLANTEELSDTARLSCRDCLAEHVVYPAPIVAAPGDEAPLISNEFTGDWYNTLVFVRIRPTGSRPADEIGWQVSGDATTQHGDAIREYPVIHEVPGDMGYVDVPIYVEGNSTLTYWPISSLFGEGEPTVVELNIDIREPQVTFTSWPTPQGVDPSGRAWYRTNSSSVPSAVIGEYEVTDDLSQTALNVAEDGPDGQVSFTAEGRNQTRDIPVVDYAENSAIVKSHEATLGRYINIDNTAPVFTGTPSTFTLVRSGTDGNGDYAVPPAGYITAVVNDPAFANGDAGSGIAPASVLRNPGSQTFRNGDTFTFTAVDYAGNVSTRTVTVSLLTGSVLIVPNAQSKQYGQPDPVFDTFPIELPSGAVLTQQPVCGVYVPHEVPGDYPITCSGAAGNVGIEYRVSNFRVFKRVPTVAVTGVSVTYDANAHAATCAVTGVGGGLTGTLTYTSSTGVISSTAPRNAGSYTAKCSFAGNEFHDAAEGTATVTIGLRPITVTGPTLSKLATAPDPSFGLGTVTAGSLVGGDVIAGTMVRVTTGLPPYAINQGTLGISPAANAANYNLTFVPGSLSILNAPTVSAPNRTDLRGTTFAGVTGVQVTGADPDGDALTFSATGLPPGMSMSSTGLITGTLTTAGTYTVAMTVRETSTLLHLTGTGSFVWTVTAPPVAVNDAVTAFGAAPVNINVLSNDNDPDGGALSVVAVTQATTSTGAPTGQVTTSGNVIVFTPTPGFTGVATFTYTIRDPHGLTSTATVTVTVSASGTCSLTGFTTYTQGGWGATPNGNNPAMLLQTKFSTVYPSGYVRIGGTKTLTFNTSAAINAFLPAGGTAAVLTASATNPTSSSGGVFAGQVLALQLNVDFSKAGVTKAGFGELLYQGYSVNDVLAAANQVLGGNTAILSEVGLSISELNAIVDSLNNNFDNGTSNNGVVTCPSGQCTATTIVLNASSSTSGTAGNIRTFTGTGVSVKASAFSRVKGSGGAWAPAFLGAFGTAGLGVTDGSEGSGADDKHKLDNIGDRFNYILFEFSKPVVVTRAFLDYIGADGDATIWLGNAADPFNNHLSLNDAVLAGLGAPQSNTSTSTADRWAAFNGGQAMANVLVIAADVTDTTPEDQFKISKLDIVCATPVVPPTVTASNKSNDEGATVSVQISASDPDNQDLTYSASGLPPGLSINATTGLITGTLGYSSAGNYNVTITVEDEDEQTATATFVWAVANKNRPPTVVANDRTDNKGATVSFQLAGTDPDGDAITYTVTGLPAGASLGNNGLISGTLTTAGTFTVSVSVKDPSNATGAATFTWIVKVPNRAPTVSVPDRTDNKGTSPTVQVTGSDLDGDALTYTATGLPPGMTMTSAGKITGTLTTSGTYNVTVTVKDPSGASGTDTFCWTVKSANAAPDAKNDTLQTSKNTAKTISVVSNDTDANGDTLTITAVSAPSKGTAVKTSNGTIKYTPASNWVGTTSFTYTISDGKGGSDTATVSVTVSSHSDYDDCDNDHDHNGSRGDHNDHRERDCDRNHTHNNDCDRDRRR